MKKCELLSPAGNMEMLKYAIHYGADAVYLAGTRFGARKFANNFTNDELIEAINFAHLYGVKVYITINTLIYDNEVDDFLEYARFIYKVGVDAVLVQDFGMLNLLHEVIPNLELHASTQMHNNGANIINLLKKIGVKRVVLDREMTLEEIKKLPKNIEKEVFCHGALCVSYSGQCLLSKFVQNRSGNRGECAGLCRLPYKLESDNKTLEKKYYLSLKDICTVNNIEKILSSNIDSLKIEGRMKSPEYVGYITYIYRQLIDAYYNNEKRTIANQEMQNIKLLFNRGFTDGFILNTENEKMVNRDTPNHQGIHLGSYFTTAKKIKILLDEDLEQGDTIRFKEENKGMTINFLYDKNDRLISHAKKNDTVYLDNFLNLESIGEVRKVASILLNKEIQKLPSRKVPITGSITIKENLPICLTISDGKNTCKVKGPIPTSARTRPIKETDILKQINKTGSSIYQFQNIEITLKDNLFINLKDLNILRREAIEKLNTKRIEIKKDLNFKTYNKIQNQMPSEYSLKVLVNTKEQLNIAKKYTDNIFTANEDLLNESVHLKLPENSKSTNLKKYMISDLGSLEIIKKGDIVSSDYMLNVTNSFTVDSLIKRGVNDILLSVENDFSNIKEITQKTDKNSLEILIYGYIELMKMKFDPTPSEANNYLIDRNNSKYSIKKQNGLNYLMSSNPLDKIDLIEEFLNLGITKYRIDFYEETSEQVEKILSKVAKLLNKKNKRFTKE